MAHCKKTEVIMNRNPIVEELKVLRDQVKVQSHLLKMDAKDEYEQLEKKFETFNQKVEDSAQKLGELTEEFWTGQHEEIKALKSKYEDLKKIFTEMK